MNTNVNEFETNLLNISDLFTNSIYESTNEYKYYSISHIYSLIKLIRYTN